MNSFDLEGFPLGSFARYEAFCKNLGRKWRLRILCCLAYYRDLRYSELKGLLTPITHKMLSEELTKLTEEGFITRQELGGVPVKVTYALSPYGRELIYRFCSLAEWINQHSD